MRVATLALVLALTTGTAWAQKIKSDFDKAAPFSQFKTYAFKPGLLMVAEGRDRIDGHILDALRHELGAKGMTEVKESPQVYVTYFGTIGGTTASGNLYAPGQRASYDWGIPQGWSGVASTTVIEGSMLFEIVNASTNQLAWRATVRGVVKNLNNPEKQEPRIKEVINKAFKDYPPKTKS